MTENDTPFKPNHTQRVFKNAANVQLHGSTYDAKHLDSFLGSGYGEKSIQVANDGGPGSARVAPGGGGGSYMMNYLFSGTSSTIKPSVSFMSMGRNDYKEIKYTDEQDGPSPMQILGNEKIYTIQQDDKEHRILFEKERDKHLHQIPGKT